MIKYYVKDIAKDLGLGKRTIIKYINEKFLPCETELWGSRIIHSMDRSKYLEWKREHFSGVGKNNISKLTSKSRDLTKNEIKNKWIPEWLDWVKTGKLNGKPTSDRMIEIYQYYFNYYLDLLPPRANLPIISVTNFRYVLGKIPIEKYSTRANVFSALMSISKYLIEKSLFTNELREDMKKLRPKRYLPAKRPCINEEQLQRVISYLNSSKSGGYYNRVLSKALILLIARSGLRASEVANLNHRDVDLEAGIISVIHGKGRKNRKVGICADLKLVLEGYLEEKFKRFDSPCINFFLTAIGTPMTGSSIHQKIERVSLHFDFHFTPHALRRAFVTINANNGRQLVHLQIACGHADITTTRSYCQTSQDEVLEAMRGW
jgi:site-specific recombinase XerD